jgi:hypothetical protein
VTSLADTINLGYVPKGRPNHAADWDHELAREQVLQLRHARWCTNSTHVVTLARKIAIVWLLLRHGVDIADTILTLTDAPTEAASHGQMTTSGELIWGSDHKSASDNAKR